MSLWTIIAEREREKKGEAKLNVIKPESTARLLQKHGFGGTC